MSLANRVSLASAASLVPGVPLARITASFAWSNEEVERELAVRLFRLEFDLDEVPLSLQIAVTADSRYVLWLNGERVGRGPLKGTPERYQVETYELAPGLRRGKNVLAAEVRWFGEEGPASEVHTAFGGWWVQGPVGADLDTPGEWRVWVDESVTPDREDPFSDARDFLGPMDRIDAARRPVNWEHIAFDASAWPRTRVHGKVPRSVGWGVNPPWALVTRELPALREETRTYARVLTQRQTTVLPWSVPARSAGECWLDPGALTTSYPVLEFEGGKGRVVRCIYAEALGYWEEEGAMRRWVKRGRRDDFETGDPHGYRDTVVLPGGPYRFEPFHWRTFRVLKVVVEAGAEAVTLRAAQHRFTTFPQEMDATFECGEPGIEKLWEISVRTLRCCAHETYEDCPYLEQLNYAGDARLQALSSFHLANDTRLARRSLQLFHDTLRGDGLLASRAPSRTRQTIPIFSLHWILMLGDYWQWVGEAARPLVRGCLGVVDTVLGYFRDRVGADGFVGGIGEWAWTDWVNEWPKGVAPVASDGDGSTVFTGWYVLALDAAVKLHREAGRPPEAERWVTLVEALRQAIRTRAWCEEEGLFLDGPRRQRDPWSQHAQVMAVLAGAADAIQRDRLRPRLQRDATLAPMSLFQRFYLTRALDELGAFETFFPRVLKPWQKLAAQGFSTWPEMEEPARSDCHAWSSWMVIDFFSTVLGVRAAAPGWTAIEIAPRFAATTRAEGKFDMTTGRVRVRWERAADGTVRLEADTPQGVPVSVKLPGVRHEFPAGGKIRLVTNAGVLLPVDTLS